MKIESCTFGSLTVDGTSYRKDLMLHEGRVIPEWRRREGHRLCAGDLEGVLVPPPEVLVIGTGAFGRMKVDPALLSLLHEAGTEVHALPTGRAAELFNEKCRRGGRVTGAFHLTC